MSVIVGPPGHHASVLVCPDHPDDFPERIQRDPFWACAECGRTDLIPDLVDRIFAAREKYRTETGHEPNLLEITSERRHELGRAVLRRYAGDIENPTDIHVETMFHMRILTVHNLSEPDGFRVRLLLVPSQRDPR